MLKPDIRLNRITDVSEQMLKNIGISALILDVDNTLSTHHGSEYVVGLENWLDGMRTAGIKLLILSNSKEKRVKPFADGLGLAYISLGLKPLPIGYLRCLKKLGTKRKNTAIVGDQIFTDVLGAKLSGITAILTRPILPEDKLSFRIRRKAEKFLLKKYYGGEEI